MHPDLASSRPGLDGSRSPLGRTLRRHRRRLLAGFVATSLLATGAAVVVLDTATLPPSVGAVGLGTVAVFRLAVEVGLLVGGCSIALLVAGLLVGDPAVRLRRAFPHSCLVPVCALFGVVLAHAVLPALLALHTPATGGVLGDTLDPVGVVELVLFFPAATGIGAALPPLSVAAVRARAIPARPTTRQRGLVALSFVVFAATHSPTDLPTFALVAAPLFAGFGISLVWLERY